MGHHGAASKIRVIRGFIISVMKQTVSFSPPPGDPAARANRWLVVAFLISTGIVFVVARVLALSWTRHVPFPGVLVTRNFLVNDPSGRDWGPAPDGLNFYDQIVAIDGQPVTSQADYDEAVIAVFARPGRMAHG